MLTPFFTAARVRDYQSARQRRPAAYGVFFRGMLERGVYLPPSQFEAWFLSGAHTARDMERRSRRASVDAAGRTSPRIENPIQVGGPQQAMPLAIRVR